MSSHSHPDHGNHLFVRTRSELADLHARTHVAAILPSAVRRKHRGTTRNACPDCGRVQTSGHQDAAGRCLGRLACAQERAALRRT